MMNTQGRGGLNGVLGKGRRQDARTPLRPQALWALTPHRGPGGLSRLRGNGRRQDARSRLGPQAPWKRN